MGRINGWYRAWIVFCGFYGLLCGSLAYQMVSESDRTFMFWVWLVPCVLLIALGKAVAWVIRGFQGQ